MASNPYAAPTATVADLGSGESGFAPARLWTLEGRIGRLRLLAYGFGFTFLLNMTLGILVGVLAVGMRGSSVPGWLPYVTWTTYLIYAVVYVLLCVRRAHDLNWSGLFGLLALVPLVNLLFVFIPGTRGANRYGLPPPPNNWGVRVLALLIPGIALVGILAAIAIPAYQAYVQRAQMSQGH